MILYFVLLLIVQNCLQLRKSPKSKMASESGSYAVLIESSYCFNKEHADISMECMKLLKSILETINEDSTESSTIIKNVKKLFKLSFLVL